DDGTAYCGRGHIRGNVSTAQELKHTTHTHTHTQTHTHTHTHHTQTHTTTHTHTHTHTHTPTHTHTHTHTHTDKEGSHEGEKAEQPPVCFIIHEEPRALSVRGANLPPSHPHHRHRHTHI